MTDWTIVSYAAAIANPGMSAWVSMKVRAELAPGETGTDSRRYGSGRPACDPDARGFWSAKRVKSQRPAGT